ncbi:Prolyl tripeptidyl peptidase precursor [Anaerohalosphaera lusitana]|uniref:Prolyl tripeptidyl peptidase n=1 Tax=Anaerohalosphaera lusitana TaxID=1936003 RepID=A0A1U9NJR3_9BACT|nr:S9 family peptidase [Anaerohalosphaera lusitana]AQT68162.1 Prolyl tripeptidyl peptidase precursor [Anaerohalosphaera lusitana]
MFKCRFLWVCVVGLSFFAVSSGQAVTIDDADEPVAIDMWLMSGPFDVPMPVDAEEENIFDKTYGIDDQLKFDFVNVDELRPGAGDGFAWSTAERSSWKVSGADGSGKLELGGGEGDVPQVYYLAAYVSVDRWTQADLTLKSCHLLEVFVDGESVKTKTSSQKPGDDGEASAGELKAELKLDTGKHLVVVKCLRDPENAAGWFVESVLKVDEKTVPAEMSFDLAPAGPISLSEAMDAANVSHVSVSPDGSVAAVVQWQYLDGGDSHEYWLELRRVSDGELLRTYRGPISIKSPEWTPDGRAISFVDRDGGKSTIWVMDIESGMMEPVLRGVKDFGGYSWSPDGSFIIYSVTEKESADSLGVHHVRDLDRRDGRTRSESYLYLLNVEAGTKRRLTFGDPGTRLQDISPDCERIIYSRSWRDYSERPFSKSEFVELDLETMEARELWENNWYAGAEYSPDGKRLLVVGGPDMFGGAGRNTPSETISNAYDSQAFIYDLETTSIDPITKDFRPEIKNGAWNDFDGKIYFETADKAFVRIYRYDPDSREFEMVETDREVASDWDMADKAGVAVYEAASTNVPGEVFAMELASGQKWTLVEPDAEFWERIELAEVKDWSFENEDGDEIMGRVYYPLDFDPARKYPCIVYYYSGTSPTSRNFSTSFHRYAANGYVTYVLQPSGAVGFGQEFSAKHVNDWGKKVAGEIITGVKKLVEEHDFIDAERIGCTGGSYGGFMTMYLQTQTDIFSAAVSHAGISSIAGYWGEGYSGFGYCAISAAESYPWNRWDIYVNQSPLFNADKIHTPLLLTHGTADTNVPTGQSTQMYTALKLLGRPVEMLEFKGEGHGIGNYKRRVAAAKAKLAWFDKYLKDQPQWWDDMYGEDE